MLHESTCGANAEHKSETMKQLQLHVKDFKHDSIKTMPFNQPTFGEPSGCWKVVPKLIFQLFQPGGLWNSKPAT